jgi:hypothetical protein
LSPLNHLTIPVAIVYLFSVVLWCVGSTFETNGRNYRQPHTHTSTPQSEDYG